MSDDPYLVDEYEHEGVRVEIRQDQDPINPRRDYDHVGTFVWIRDHNTRDYDLADEMVQVERGELMVTCPACRGRGEFDGARTRSGEIYDSRLCEHCDGEGEVSTDDIVKWAKQRYDAHLVIPLHFEDGRYSGDISLDDSDSANGFVYVTREEIVSEWGSKGTLTGQATKRARQYLLATVEEYAAYSRGEVYGWVAELNGESESCWGYFGDDEHLREAANEGAREVLARVNRENYERQFWLERGVMTVG
jgi:hypothetical protein